MKYRVRLMTWLAWPLGYLQACAEMRGILCVAASAQRLGLPTPPTATGGGPLPTPDETYLEVIAAFPGPNLDDMPVHVLRDLAPQAFTEPAADITAATQRGDSIEPVVAIWAAVQ